MPEQAAAGPFLILQLNPKFPAGVYRGLSTTPTSLSDHHLGVCVQKLVPNSQLGLDDTDLPHGLDHTS